MINLQNISERLQVDVHQRLSKQKRRWSNSSDCNVLLITSKGRVPESQIFPFYYYRNALGISIREVDISKLENNIIFSDVDVILFQPWFKLGAEKISDLLRSIVKANPKARIIYVDSSAPVDLRFAESVEPYIDLYLKKNIFSDQSEYGVATQGDTNLMQYYENLYDLPASDVQAFPVTKYILSKLIVGPSFFTSNKMLSIFINSDKPTRRRKDILIHARMNCKGTPWYHRMRESALLACMPYKEGSIITDKLVSYSKYYNELMKSKICFSPFGYGEVCWRDYEAILAGALLIKPDMSHVETCPNIYIPYETYIPVKWDFSDLEEKLEYYLSHEKESNDITLYAYSLLHNYCKNDGFIKQMAGLFIK